MLWPKYGHLIHGSTTRHAGNKSPKEDKSQVSALPSIRYLNQLKLRLILY